MSTDFVESGEEEEDIGVDGEEEEEEEEQGLGIYPPGKSPFEAGVPERRYGVRDIPLEPDASQFVAWNLISACFGYITTYFLCFQTKPSSGITGRLSMRISAFVRRVVDDVRIISGIPIRIFRLIWGWIKFIVELFMITYDVNIPVLATAIPIPLPLWILLFLIIFYLLNAFWPLVLIITVTVIVPAINFTLLLLTFIINAVLLVLRIVFTIWNMNVPFLGIQIYFLFTLVFTVFEIVFDLLKASGIMEIFQSLMQVIFFIVDLGMQAMMVFLQLQMSALQVMSEVFSYMMKLFFTAIEYVMDIFAWVMDYLFVILEPILMVVQYIASAFSWMASSSSSAAYASRKLFEVGAGVSKRQMFSLGLTGLAMSGNGGLHPAMSPAPNEFAPTTYKGFVSSIHAQWENSTMYMGNNTEMKLFEGMTEVNEWLDSVGGRESSETPTYQSLFAKPRGVPENFGNPSAFGRKLLQRDFQDRRSAGINDAPSMPDVDIPLVDHTTQIYMTHFHSGVRNMVKDPTVDLDQMHRSFNRIRTNQKRGKDELAIVSIMSQYEQERGFNKGLPKGPAHVRFVNEPLHPTAMHNMFTEIRKDYADRHGLPSTYAEYKKKMDKRSANPTGRSLLSSTWSNSQDVHAEHLGRMEREHARQIISQPKTFKDYHYKKIRTVNEIGHALRGCVYEQGQTVLHPDLLAAHGTAILQRHGYNSLKEVWDTFNENHDSVEDFWLAVTNFRENPFFKSFFHSYDRLYQHKHFEGWSNLFQEEEQLRYTEERPGADHFMSKRLRDEGLKPSERHLLESKSKLEGLEVIATTTCWSVPRNFLCAPDLSGIGIFSPSLISVPSDITEDSDVCDPWEPSTQIWSTRRLVNGWHSLRFIVSAFPPTNYLLFGFTLIFPFLSWMVDWVFLVEGGETASFDEVFCFIIHIYDLFILALTYAFFRYIIYPIIEELLLRPIQLNILAHNQQYDLQAKTAELSDSDPRLERIIRLQLAMKAEEDARYNNFRVIVQQQQQQQDRPAVINSQINMFGIHHNTQSKDRYMNEMMAYLNDPSLTDEQHARLREYILSSLGNYNIHNQPNAQCDSFAANIARLGMAQDHPSMLDYRKHV